MQTFKKLPVQFSGIGEVKGYEFTQISTTYSGFCYEVNISGTITHYEVFNRKINTRFNCESYPTSKAFGIWAWTCRTKEKAIEKLNNL